MRITINGKEIVVQCTCQTCQGSDEFGPWHDDTCSLYVPF